MDQTDWCLPLNKEILEYFYLNFTFLKSKQIFEIL